MGTLGDPRYLTPEGGADEGYSGEAPSTSLLSWDYYRTKAREFQSLMNALDDGYRAATNTLALGVDDATADYLHRWIDEFDSRRTALRGIAEGINMAAAVVNTAGGRLPVLSIPSTLGALGVLPAVALTATSIAAFGAVAAAITWGAQLLSGLNERLATAQLLDAQATPEARGALAAEVSRARQAQDSWALSPLAALGPLLKWGAIGLGAWALYMLWQRHGKG